MLPELYFLDIIGTFTFAVYGSYFAIKKDFDLFGIFIAAFLTAVGGGTIRELMLNNHPFYFQDTNYIIAILAALVFTIIIHKRFHKVKKLALFLDSVGLVTFAFIGASKAFEANLGLFATVFFATISAVGGGVMRDVVLGEIPQIMKYDLYASVALLLGLSYGLIGNHMNTIIAYSLILTFLIIRLLIIFYKVNLWKPKH